MIAYCYITGHATHNEDSQNVGEMSDIRVRIFGRGWTSEYAPAAEYSGFCYPAKYYGQPNEKYCDRMPINCNHHLHLVGAYDRIRPQNSR